MLGRYVRERNVLTLAEAVHKMSGLPAEQMGFTDRGLIRPGMKADLLLFDAETVIDRSTQQAPREVSTGIERVWVNGEVVYEEGKTTGRFPGDVIRRE